MKNTMRLRSGTKYNYIKPISINNVIIIQSIARRYISFNKYKNCIRAIRLLKENAPHLYKYKPKTKKSKSKTKKSEKGKIEVNETSVNDLTEIIAQYNDLKYLGRSAKNGIIRSKRKNKGKNPTRYIDPDFKKIFMEDNTIDDFLGSDIEDIDSDYLEEDIVYSGEEDGEWNIDSEEVVSESDEEF